MPDQCFENASAKKYLTVLHQSSTANDLSRDLSDAIFSVEAGPGAMGSFLPSATRGTRPFSSGFPGFRLAAGTWDDCSPEERLMRAHGRRGFLPRFFGGMVQVLLSNLE